MKPHVQTWKLIHKTENGSGQGTGRASDLLRGEVAARPGWKPDQEPGDSNGTWTVPRADGVDPHAGSQLTARGDPLKHPAARNRESSRSAGPSRAGQLRAPAAQEGAVTLRTPRPRRAVMHKVPKRFSSLRALLSSLLPHQTLPFWGHISKLLGGGSHLPHEALGAPSPRAFCAASNATASAAPGAARRCCAGAGWLVAGPGPLARPRPRHLAR